MLPNYFKKSIYETAIDLKNNVLRIRGDFNDTRLRVVAFEYSDGTQPYLFLTPPPVVSHPPRQYLGLPLDPRANFIIGSDDFYVKDVSRKIPREVFKTRAWVDAYYTVANGFRGIACRVHLVEDGSGVVYNLLLKRELEQTKLLY